MCLFLFSSEKPDREEMKGKYGEAYADYLDYPVTFKITMCQAPCNEPACWCITMLCYCPVQIFMRHRVLNHVDPGSGWSNYKCCQGYFGGCCCLQPGSLGESSCPIPCMCLEACCFPGAAVSATSFVIRERYQLGLDDDDVRLIRCNNCIQCFALILNCIGICFDWEGEDSCKDIVNCIADTVFCCVSGCMTAQVYHEVKVREAEAPVSHSMMR